MIDRLFNLISVFCFVVVFSTATVSSYDAWESTKSWDKEWARKVNKFGDSPVNAKKYSSEEITNAMRKAYAASDYSAVRVLEDLLVEHFEETGEVKLRFSDAELLMILKNILLALLTFILPISLNYIKNGKFRAWNPST